MEQKYDFVEVTLDTDYDMIKEVYRLHKEQANKLFDITSKISSDEDIMRLVKDRIEYSTVLLVRDNEASRFAGCFTFEGIVVHNDKIVKMEVHPIISKKYWGKQSRDIIEACYKFIEKYWYPVERIEAFVPSNNFGVIKLLKDVGFTIEGTLKNRLIYKDKNGNEKYYNQLVYSDINRRK